MPLLMEGGFHSKSHDTWPHSFFHTDQSSWSLCRKTAPKHDVSTPMLHSRYGVLQIKIKSLLLSHHHNTSALVSEILMSVLQTVQKKQQTIYIWTDSAKKTTNNLHMDRQCKKNNKQFTYGQTVQKNCTGAFTVLQTVQKINKQFTYGQTVQKKNHYIWTDSAKKLHWSIYSAPDSAKKQQQFTYGQYIFTDCTEDNVQNTHTYTQYT